MAKGSPAARTIIAASPAMIAVLQKTQRAAKTDESVLLLGESGTGKELLARSIHEGSARAEGPFVAVNCGALPESMVEATLFGHEKGAFTGADVRRAGKFVEANKGTLFLDEIGETTLAVQVKLLRALQEREVEPLGGRAVSVDVRVVAATSRNLSEMISRGQFREDLYYRLDVLQIRVPPLRERREDVRPLVEHFLSLALRDMGHGALRLEPSALALLTEQRWPGNVRQLQNFVKKMVLATDSATVDANHLAQLFRESEPAPARVKASTLPPRSSAVVGETRPRATRSDGDTAGQGLAIAWWRFSQVEAASEPLYSARIFDLARAVKIESVALKHGRARLGREAGRVEVCLETAEVSRHHATIQASEKGFTFEDEGSRNHSYVNGQQQARGERTALCTGSVLRIGKEWLGIAIEFSRGVVPSVELLPMRLASEFARAGGSANASIDITALEAICAAEPALDDRALQQLAAHLCGLGEAAAVTESDLALGAPAFDWRTMTRAELLSLIDQCAGNKREAARRLKVSPTTFAKLLKTTN